VCQLALIALSERRLKRNFSRIIEKVTYNTLKKYCKRRPNKAKGMNPIYFSWPTPTLLK